MYDILQLNDMLIPELRELAEQLELKGYKRLDKQELIYRILDAQASDSQTDNISIDFITKEEKKLKKEVKKLKKLRQYNSKGITIDLETKEEKRLIKEIEILEKIHQYESERIARMVKMKYKEEIEDLKNEHKQELLKSSN